MKWWRLALLVVLIVIAYGIAAAPATADRQGMVRGSVFVNPLAVTLQLSESSVRTGEQLQATAKARNLGPQPLTDVALQLRIDPVGIATLNPATQSIAVLAGGATGTVTWRLCGREAGNYMVMVTVRARAAGNQQVTAESAAVLLRVRSGGRTTCPTS